ncbi:MAG: methenyltetrahydrofolate cyclohydrolase [Desulfobacteraceae bacterium]|nr:MAG: methenyltetrahydrofolate cyclohydrolase [Desulfobacteraceae bacterium]
MEELAGFISSVSNGTPTPGGGSVSALAGSLASALVEMVANLTVNRKGFEEHQQTMIAIRDAAESLRKELLAGVTEDSRVYLEVMEAYRLPKASDEEKKRRSLDIQKRLKKAADVPFLTAKASVRVLEIALQVVENGNPNAITDGGVGALLAHAAMEGAILNVRVNISRVSDLTYNQEMERDLGLLKQKGDALKEQILAVVREKMGIS